MRVFFDTNVLFSAFATEGVCFKLLYRCMANHTVCISPYVIKELKTKLHQKIGQSAEEFTIIEGLLNRKCLIVKDGKAETKISRDPKDDPILEAAHAAQADCILTGDKDLLVLGSFQNIPILQPNLFERFERQQH